MPSCRCVRTQTQVWTAGCPLHDGVEPEVRADELQELSLPQRPDPGPLPWDRGAMAATLVLHTVVGLAKEVTLVDGEPPVTHARCFCGHVGSHHSHILDAYEDLVAGRLTADREAVGS